MAALEKTKKEDVPLLYWTAAAWAGAMALKINDSEVSADQPIVDALARRALALDPSWEMGSIHEFFVSWESGRSSIGGSKEKALEHYQEALRLSRGLKASPYVTYAESIAVPEQDRAGLHRGPGEGARRRRHRAERSAARERPHAQARRLAAGEGGRVLHRVGAP